MIVLLVVIFCLYLYNKQDENLALSFTHIICDNVHKPSTIIS